MPMLDGSTSPARAHRIRNIPPASNSSVIAAAGAAEMKRALTADGRGRNLPRHHFHVMSSEPTDDPSNLHPWPTGDVS
jgi:hypothetical protein